MSAGPKFSTKPSLHLSVKVRTRQARSSCSTGRSTDCASSTSPRTRSRKSSARGVGTSPRPARTSNGSPVAVRNRARARLIAEGLSRKRRAARATLPSASSTSRVTSKLRSGDDMRPTLARLPQTWRQTHA